MSSSPRLSSCVLLARHHEGTFQLFWAKRRPELAFLGGFHAFPGGSIEDGDRDLTLPTRETDQPTHDDLALLIGCAARELFEEVGLLFTKDGAYSRHVGVEAPALERWRLDAHASGGSGERALAASLLADNLALDHTRYVPMGRWTTPEWIPIRFETEFFLALLTEDEARRVDSDALCGDVQTSELMEAAWITPADAVCAHEEGRVILSAPTIALLRHLARVIERDPLASDVGRCDQADQDPLTLLEHVGGTYMISLESPTIPPSTHTNCAIVGEREFVVIDPGSDDPKQLAMLYPAIDASIARGGQFRAIVLTHHHVDHVCGVPALLERYGDVPIWAHPLNAQWLDSAIPEISRALVDGDVIELDGGSHDLECVFTPGHAPGHLALLHRRSHTLFCGDLVASQGTILVRPPEGHMGDYLSSLARVRAMNVRALHPAHGWTITRANEKLSEYESHRLAREEQVFKALQQHDGWTEPMELVPEVYADVSESIWFIAAMSLTAHLIHLHEIGRIEREGEGSLRFRRLD